MTTPTDAVPLLLAFNIALAVIAALGGWLLKTLFTRLDKLEKNDERLNEALTNLQVALPTGYVTKEDNKAQLDAIHEVLRRIEDKLDRKADK